MTGDDSAASPGLPALDGALGSPDFPLRRELSPEDDRLFTLAGAGLRAEGGCARGLERLAVSDRAVMARFRVEGVSPTGMLLTPLGLERHLRLGGQRIVERVALAGTQPVCFLEWECASPATLVLSWVLPPGPDGEVRWESLERGLLVDRGVGRTFLALSEAPDELIVQPVPGDGGTALEVRVEVTTSALRLGLGEAAAPGAEARVLRVLAHPEFVIPAARAAAQKTLDERLSLDAPDAAVGEGLQWAVVRLSRMVRPLGWPAADSPGRQLAEERALRLALASLAAGDRTPSKELVRGRTAGVRTGATAFRYLELVVQYLQWTGDRATVRGAWEGVRSAALALVDRQLEAEAEANGEVERGARRVPAGFAETVEDMGDGELADRLRGHEELRGGDAESKVGGAGSDTEGEAADGLRAAALIDAVVHGLLGADPDAARGRLVLRPRLPAGWTRFTVRNLRVGAASVDLAYDHTAAVHRFTLRQDRGGPPLQVVFEPELPGDELVAARVDGQPAALDAGVAGGRLRVPVQLVLDHERAVEVEIRGADD